MMKKLNYIFALIALVAMSSCSKVKDYKISGSFDIPAAVQVGDSVVERGDIGGLIYLLDIDGEPIDSAQIENETFVFTGKVDKSNPYFAYLVCEWGAGLVAIEPGEIQAELTLDGVRTVGTPMNDGIADLEAALANSQNAFYDEMMALYNSGNSDSLSQTQMMNFYMRMQSDALNIIDSVYQKNDENLVGVYAANLLVGQAASVEELDEQLGEYSEYVQNSPLIQSFRRYLTSAGLTTGGDNAGVQFDFGQDLLDVEEEQ
ncbi:MAG: DUF4369 domain-containing protein [Bacteroidales bacterium]|nr:DUF4369 domain-containing protein [Bacteroidales bacterium]